MIKKKRTYRRRKIPKDLSDPKQLRKEIIAQMRRVYWYYFRPKALKLHRERDDNGFYWICSSKICVTTIREEKNAKVDHIDPVRDTELSEQSWDVYFRRLFVPPEKTQILCKNCHDDKSQYELDLRNKVKRGT